MSRVLGIVGKCNVVESLIVGLYAQIYAGSDGTGIACLRDGKMYVHKGQGPASSVFPVYNQKMASCCAIGHNACALSEIQPFRLLDKNIAIVMDAPAKIVEKVRRFLRESKSELAGVEKALQVISEPFALLVLSKGKIIAARNSGIKPLSFGRARINGDTVFYVSSQSGVLHDGHFIKTVTPGEIVVLSHDRYEGIVVLDHASDTRCIQETLYLQRPGNICGGREVGQVRCSIGEHLGNKFLEDHSEAKGNDDWFAFGILDGGRQLAMGISRTGIRTDPSAFVRNIYSIPPKMRSIAVKCGLGENFALTPLSYVKGKKVIIADDLIRSGDKMADIARKCRKMGAIEVHGLVGVTGKSTCPHGNASYVRQEMIGSSHDQAAIAKSLGLESFTSLSLPELLLAINTPRINYCQMCLQ